MIKIGDRIGLILKTNVNTKECFFLGYGVYEGRFVPDIINCSKKYRKNAKWLIRENKEICRFKLDNGEIFYEFDTWCMSEERFNAVFVNDEYKEGWKVINIDRYGKRRKQNDN